MDYHKAVVKLFDTFYNKLYKSNYKLDLSINNQKKIVDNFIKLIARHYQLDTVGINFFLEYFSFAFSYYADKTLKRKISLNWIIGKKIFNKFLVRNEHSAYFYEKFLNEYGINKDIVKQQIFEEEQIEIGLSVAEELEKKRFEGSARLYNCLMNTTLYNHRSGVCMKCVNKEDCKLLLQEKYPKVYKKRGYK